MSSALRRILRDQQSMRVEEESEDGWFALPLVDDADVNWMDFEVDICGPVCALLRSEAWLPCQLKLQARA